MHYKKDSEFGMNEVLEEKCQRILGFGFGCQTILMSKTQYNLYFS
jgi:hypothetical protein